MKYQIRKKYINRDLLSSDSDDIIDSDDITVLLECNNFPEVIKIISRMDPFGAHIGIIDEEDIQRRLSEGENIILNGSLPFKCEIHITSVGI